MAYPENDAFERERAVIELVENKRTSALERLRDAIEGARINGVPEDEISTMVSTTAIQHDSDLESCLPGFPAHAPDRVYTDLPPGLIDVPSASKKYNVHTAVLRGWLRKKRLQLQGRLKAPASGGGYLVIDESELVAYLSAPRDKGGRPKKR